MKRNNLAMAFDAAGRYEEAIAQRKSAVEMKPDYAEGFNTLGKPSCRPGRYADATAAFGRAIRLKPDYALAHWNLSLILLLRGDLRGTGWNMNGDGKQTSNPGRENFRSRRGMAAT